jgi:competence protein ComEC
MPLLWLSLAFLLGIVLAASLVLPTTTWLVLAAAALLLTLLRLLLTRLSLRGSRITLRPLLSSLPYPLSLSPIPYPLLFFVLFLGSARYQAAQPRFDANFIAWYNDRESNMVVEGVLTEPSDVRDAYTNLRIAVDQLRPVEEAKFTPVRGLLLARVQLGGDWHYGDRLRLTGQLVTPPENEDFSYRDYLAQEGVYSLMEYAQAGLLQRSQGNLILAVIYAIKEHALVTVYRIFPDPEASLMAGILLGVDTSIPQPVQEAFKATGTAHIIAISGFNISIVAGLFALFFSRLLGPRRGAIATIFGIALYTIMVGAEASVVRAAIMGGLGLFAAQVGRRQNGLNSLALVAAVMALINPQVLWGISFQLSFAATLGLVLYADPLTQVFTRLASHRLPQPMVKRLTGWVGEYILFTLAAQILTLPVMAYHFRRISVVSLVANPVILPVQPPVEVLGGLAVLLGMIYPPLGQMAAYLAWPFVVFTIRAVELLAKVPAAALSLGQVALPVVILFYAVLFLLTFGRDHLRRWAPMVGPAVPLTVLALLAVLTWRAGLSAPDGRLHLTLFDVDSGEAILIQTLTGRNLLINSGPSTTQLSDALGRRLSFFDRGLDTLVVAGTGNDRIGALPDLVERFPPVQVLWAGPTHSSRSARLLQEALLADQIPITTAEAGQELDLGDGASLLVKTVGKNGAILLLTYGRFSAALPLGVEAGDLEALKFGSDIGPVTALLLANNGAAPTNPVEWLTNLNPQVALLSASPTETQELPFPEVLLSLQGYTLLRTDKDGWIELSTDGQRMWVEVERK